MASQLALPLQTSPALGRADFIVAPGNAHAVAYIDAFPRWSMHAAALYGPSGSGKSHLATAWGQTSGAAILEAAALNEQFVRELAPGRPVAVENVDRAGGTSHEAALFALFNRPEPLLLTGIEPPNTWPAVMPDLVSRFGALLAFSLWKPDDALLASLTRKLFTDRQLAVPDPVIMRILRSVERSPAAIRDFVARADACALAEKRPVTVALVAELLTSDGAAQS